MSDDKREYTVMVSGRAKVKAASEKDARRQVKAGLLRAPQGLWWKELGLAVVGVKAKGYHATQM